MPTVRELGIGFVAYSPLGRGFLSGEIKTPNDFPPVIGRGFFPRFQGENFQKNLDVVRKVFRDAEREERYGRSARTRLVLARAEDIVPIPGTKRRSYLEQNVAAVEIR